jgi:nucleoside-diphosphate-sugar epimerase
MKITLTGAAGNITKPLTEKLLTAGHTVTVVGRKVENLKSLIEVLPANLQKVAVCF